MELDMYLSRWMLYQLMQSSLLRYLKLAFFPVMACILLAGHASGQTPPRSVSLDNNNAWSNCSTAAPLTLRAIWAGTTPPRLHQSVEFGFQEIQDAATEIARFSDDVCN